MHADGLSYGMYQLLLEYLQDTPWRKRLVSAERIIAALRGRKIPTEIERIRAAIETTGLIYELHLSLRPSRHLRASGGGLYACLAGRIWRHSRLGIRRLPYGNSGPDSPVGHVSPAVSPSNQATSCTSISGSSKTAFAPTSNVLRTSCAPARPGRPPEVQHGFDTVRSATQAAVDAMRPGVTGQYIDFDCPTHRRCGWLPRV